MYGNTHMDKRYGEEVMFLIEMELQMYTLRIINDVKDSDGRSRHAWMVSSSPSAWFY